jgi:predicted metal-dependent enzyme (double-stranded beta helix superfamily)
MAPTTSDPGIAARRQRACQTLMRQAHAILDKEGSTPSALHALKIKLAALAARAELFPTSEFPLPVHQGRLHSLLVEPDDGLALHLLIGMPGKMSNPHAHSIWCVNASVHGSERHVMWRRTDDGSVPGHATIKPVGEVLMERGHGYAMADHDIHSQQVVGDEPSVILALYGHTFERFPSVIWFNQEFSTVRKLPSRRGQAAA